VQKIENPKGGSIDRIKPLTEVQFDRCLFLDTDTYILEDVSKLENVLNRYDICYCHAPFRKNPKNDPDDVPECYVQPNAGVILYKNSREVSNLFDSWLEEYNEMWSNKQIARDDPPDQPSLQKVLYKSDLKEYILPPEYNLRVPFEFFIGGNSSVKIIHGEWEKIREIKAKTEKTKTNYPRTSPLRETPSDLAERAGTRNLLKALQSSLKSKFQRLVKDICG
jgi:hypothetical protein